MENPTAIVADPGSGMGLISVEIVSFSYLIPMIYYFTLKCKILALNLKRIFLKPPFKFIIYEL